MKQWQMRMETMKIEQPREEEVKIDSIEAAIKSVIKKS